MNVATIGPLCAVIAFAAWRRWLGLARFMLLPIALLCVTFLVMPNNLFGGQYADARLPIAILLIVIAAVDLSPMPTRSLIVCTTLALGLLIVRTAVIASEWRGSATMHFAGTALG